MRVSESSQWKMNFLNERPLNQFNAKPLLNASLYQFDDISLIEEEKKDQQHQHRGAGKTPKAASNMMIPDPTSKNSNINLNSK